MSENQNNIENQVANENEESARLAENTGKAESEFEFVTETIKKKPVNKRRVIKKTVYSVLLGLLMGVVASIVFVLFMPKLQDIIYPEEMKEITIPEEITEEQYPEEDEITEENTDIEDSAEETGAAALETETPEETGEDPEGTTPEENADSAENEEASEEKTVSEVPAPIINQIIEEKSFTIDDYKQIYRKMGDIASEASKSIAIVTGVSDSTDWFMNKYETGNETAGLIIADNGKELLIITNNINLTAANEIEVTFCNGETYKGVVKKSDKETGLVVVGVILADLSPSVNNSIEMAKFGNSSVSTLPGTPVIAIGAPLGITDSMAIGLVTSNKRLMDIVDSNLRYITTDIYGSTTGSGVIIDLEGRVLGIIFQGGLGNDSKNLIHAYSISDIKSKLEKLSNGQELAYLGIKGTDVTKEVNETLHVPMGAYVTQVIVDSPAMNAGIQNGDIIVKLGTTDITSFVDYKEAMLKCQPGDLMVVTVKRPGKDDYLEFSYEISLEAQP